MSRNISLVTAAKILTILESMDTKEEKISELAKRFLQAMSELNITGYRLKQDGVINSEPTLTKIKKGAQEPSRKTVDLFCEKYGANKSWIYTGEGEMLSDKSKPASVSIIRESVPNGGSNYKMVPLIHIDSVGGMRSKNEIVNEPQYVDQYIPFVNAQEGDIAIIQTGISMTPTIPPGSILQLRKVENWREYFGYGNIFVIELTDGRRITKEVTRYDSNPNEYIWCVSHNPDVPDEELPKSMIASVWKVIKVLTDKGW